MKSFLKFTLLIVSVFASATLYGQLSEKDLKKIQKFEIELESGDIYKANKYADKLIKKYPNEFVVVDYKIRCVIKIYLESFVEHKSAMVNVTSRPVRRIWYQDLIELIDREFQLDATNAQSCTYVAFLHEHGNEQPYDSVDTRTLLEMFSADLDRLNKKCE